MYFISLSLLQQDEIPIKFIFNFLLFSTVILNCAKQLYFITNLYQCSLNRNRIFKIVADILNLYKFKTFYQSVNLVKYCVEYWI